MIGKDVYGYVEKVEHKSEKTLIKTEASHTHVTIFLWDHTELKPWDEVGILPYEEYKKAIKLLEENK